MERYVITTESYIYADSDKKAKSLAKYIQGKQRKQYDNQCYVTKLQSAPFGRIGSDTNLIEGEIL
tara:strand:+ start:268 stop:462 length:195 start_codon:yes stop_codon:yes gene_type:complete